MIESFDFALISFLNGFARRSVIFDNFVVVLAENSLLKGGIVTTMLWWAWFRSGEGQARRDDLMLSALVACLVSLLVAMGLGVLLPLRFRPLYSPELAFQSAYGFREPLMDNWSAFPSDHATLFLSLATGIFFLWRALGAIAFPYVLVAILFPRVYLGYHFPTDMVAGAVIGVAITAAICSSAKIRNAIHAAGMRLRNKTPGMYYAGLFLWSHQIATLFSGPRRMAIFAAKALREFLNPGAF